MTNWTNTVSRDHVQHGLRGRFTQATHGKPNMLRKMARGDWIIFYSPKKPYPDGEPLQAFTAIGQVASQSGSAPHAPERLQDQRIATTPTRPTARTHPGSDSTIQLFEPFLAI